MPIFFNFSNSTSWSTRSNADYQSMNNKYYSLSPLFLYFDVAFCFAFIQVFSIFKISGAVERFSRNPNWHYETSSFYLHSYLTSGSTKISRVSLNISEIYMGLNLSILGISPISLFRTINLVLFMNSGNFPSFIICSSIFLTNVLH